MRLSPRVLLASVLVLTVAVGIVAYLLTRRTTDGVPIVLGPVVGLMVVAVVAILHGAYGATRLTDTRAEHDTRQRADAQVIQPDGEPEAESGVEPGAEPGDGPATTRSERVLVLQVQTLETALEEQADDFALLQRELEKERDEARAEALQGVATTIRALRAVVHAEPEAEQVMARVEAALNRLESRPVFGRPALPNPAVRTARALVPAAPSGRLAATGAAVATAPAQVERAVEAQPAATAPETDQPVQPAYATEDPVGGSTEPEVVLPVPAPPATQPSRRGRRRWSRAAA